MKIIFMGTSDFSLKALKAIYELTQTDKNYEIVAVYSQPPKPFGRGYKLKKSMTHEFAEKVGLLVQTPKGLRKPEQAEIFKSLNADIAIVAAYGLIIPQNILDIPPKGFINIHGSLLPHWRGAAPIQSAILAGDKNTGITIMKMDAGVDTGDIISMESVNITPKMNHGELSEILGNLGARMIVDTIKNLDECLTKSYPQPNEGVTFSQKILKENCKINWKNSAENILRQILALAPTPAAWCEIQNIRLKIFDAEIIDSDSSFQTTPGLIQNNKNFIVACGDKFLKISKLQPSGKNIMDGESFLHGHTNLIHKIIE